MLFFQIEHAEQKLKSIASGKSYLDKATFEKTYQSTMGILTSKIYDKLKENDKGNKERVQITKILCLADRIHGTSSSLVEALLALFADFNTVSYSLQTLNCTEQFRHCVK